MGLSSITERIRDFYESITKIKDYKQRALQAEYRANEVLERNQKNLEQLSQENIRLSDESNDLRKKLEKEQRHSIHQQKLGQLDTAKQYLEDKISCYESSPSPDCMFLLDPRGNIRYQSEQATKLFGEGLEGTRISELIFGTEEEKSKTEGYLNTHGEGLIYVTNYDNKKLPAKVDVFPQMFLYSPQSNREVESFRYATIVTIKPARFSSLLSKFSKGRFRFVQKSIQQDLEKSGEDSKTDEDTRPGIA